MYTNGDIELRGDDNIHLEAEITTWTLDCLNNIDSYDEWPDDEEFRMIPLTWISKKDLFHLKMTGKLP